MTATKRVEQRSTDMNSANRILIIDDNKDIHTDFRKVFDMASRTAELDELEADLFGSDSQLELRQVQLNVEIDSAYQGEEGISMALGAARGGRPYYMAFVDVRMPPGIDGILTIKRLWEHLPGMPCVICTAFSDYDWKEIALQLGKTGNLLILKKPFDAIEVLQLAQSMAEKVELSKSVQHYVAMLERKVQELTWAEENLQRSNADLLQAKNVLEAQAVELVRKSEQLEASRKGAEAANKAKGQFLANMSHELRTPLNGVLGMTHLLLSTNLDSQQRRYARTAYTSAESLLHLINDILDFSKIEAGKMELETIDFDFRAAIGNVMEAVTPQARRKELELACSVESIMPRRLRGDPSRLQQVLANLTSNAVKFTESGEVVVRATVAEQSERHLTVRFTVTDTGIGIAPDRLDRLFHSFSQVDSSTTRRYGGTGLGLAISKHLCILMGGQIGVESILGRGSTFWCTMVLEKTPQETKEARIVAAEAAGTRVLVVDDNPTCREIVEQQLRSSGFMVESTADGPAALAALRVAAQKSHPFHLAILDYQMPRMDGEQLALAIKSDATLAATKLLLLTYLGEPLEMGRLESAGFADCLTKPVLQAQLLETVFKVLGVSSRIPPLGGSEAIAPSTGKISRPVAVHGNRGSILLAEDNEINQDLVAEILRDARFRCDIVSNGAQAVQAVLEKPYDLVLMDCHMPEMDGLCATKLIREKEQAGLLARKRPTKLPIVALTANALSGDREACLQAGMTDYLSKPFYPEQIVQTVEKHLSMVERIRELASEPAEPSEAASESERDGGGPEVEPLDFQDLLRRCLGNQKLLERTVAKFQERLPKELQQIEESLAQGDISKLILFAHSLKGAAASLSASWLQAAAAQLEMLAKASDLAAAQHCLPALREQCRRILQLDPRKKMAAATV